MKKTYINPNVVIIQLNMQKSLLIAISNGEAAEGTSGNKVNFSRGGSDWDDEE